jgi:hypothetical protein
MSKNSFTANKTFSVTPMTLPQGSAKNPLCAIIIFLENFVAAM